MSLATPFFHQNDCKLKLKNIMGTHIQQKKTPTPRQFIGQNDFLLLKAQKIVLLELQGKQKPNDVTWLVIESILNMIDGMQDVAVSIGFDKNHVFNFSDEDGHIDLEDAEQIILEKAGVTPDPDPQPHPDETLREVIQRVGKLSNEDALRITEAVQMFIYPDQTAN